MTLYMHSLIPIYNSLLCRCLLYVILNRKCLFVTIISYAYPEGMWLKEDIGAYSWYNLAELNCVVCCYGMSLIPANHFIN